ncbi:FAD-dependent oxidoreductase [Cytobacillus gottheilii]|uniref:FAD-dependent oxidoreductase n=1 Tax=Cytobacillus gottheilii TaxID=859144 RepID=UPI0034640837
MTNQMPRFPESYWTDIDLPSFQPLKEDTSADVVIVGGGITGITSAYLLAKEGLKVTLLEAGKILNGTTAHTTAKITAQHGVIYDEFIQHFGLEKTKLYYEASKEAQEFILKVKNELNIDCDYSEQDAIIYAESDEYREKLKKEMSAYEKLGITGHLGNDFPFPIETKAVLTMNNQAQFHPLKYLHQLVQAFTDMGGTIYENTTAVDLEKGERPDVVTREGHRVKSKYVIAASHFPFADMKGFYFARLLPERSYVIAIKAEKEYPEGMYYSADQPKRSLRYTPVNGEKLLLIGGEGHKTGKGPDTLKHYEALEQFASSLFGIKEYPYRWSAQDLTSLDKMPYIGPITADQPHIFVATGYRKWGMTNGTAAALLLRDQILEKENPYSELFSPSRFVADPSIKKVISYNTDTAGQLLKGKLEYVPKEISDLSNDEGAVVIVDGKRSGAYKDMDGKLHVVDTTCTHMGCETRWNHGERTWDCPCHGSRFSYDGEVVEGPADKPLKKLNDVTG